MKKDDIFTVEIEDMSETGEGIGKTDGFTWFIKDSIIGDTVRAKAMKVKKKYGYAKLLSVEKPSDARVDALCPVARRCGGCQLQAMSYEAQLKYKERKIIHNLMRIGGFSREELHMLPIIGMEEPWRYRNKAQFPFGINSDGGVAAGFYAGRTHAIIENDDCLLGPEINGEILIKIKSFMESFRIESYDESTRSGLVRHALIRVGYRTGEIMVCMVVNGKELPHSEKLVESLLEIPRMTSISYNINMDNTNVILGDEVIHLYGPGFITDYIGDVRYRISPLSFYQVNPIQTEKLYNTVLEFAALDGKETVWDLYCGIGTISLFLAQRAGHVYGVEVIPQAIEDARENAGINGIENVEFFVGKAEEVLPAQYEQNHVRADVIVVDPPRKGCDKVCLDTIVKMSPEKVVYVSCDSATLARDLKYLREHGFEIVKARGCDLFPMTCHCESIVLLQRKG